ncbi:uncharacterized protein LOC144100213 isoform X2 [Amblyomma americanum]
MTVTPAAIQQQRKIAGSCPVSRQARALVPHPSRGKQRRRCSAPSGFAGASASITWVSTNQAQNLLRPAPSPAAVKERKKGPAGLQASRLAWTTCVASFAPSSTLGGDSGADKGESRVEYLHRVLG